MENYFKFKGGKVGDRTSSSNFDTIKLQPATLTRLRNCCRDDKQRPDSPITYDELLNRLMDKVEDKESPLIAAGRQ